jgi:hemolysin III
MTRRKACFAAKLAFRSLADQADTVTIRRMITTQTPPDAPLMNEPASLHPNLDEDLVRGSAENRADDITSDLAADVAGTPVKLDEEWANSLTHCIATVGAILLGSYLVLMATDSSTGLAIACLAYVASVVGTFLCSTLSHTILRQPWLNQLRAWDQAMIYLMIAGTYTPIAFRFAPDSTRTFLLIALWGAALSGFITKVALKHRINSIGTVSYLLLGWLPAIPLAGHVPGGLVTQMIIGGVLYSVGVAFLMNDSKFRYAHAVWHLFVMSAATCHWYGIIQYTTV